MLIAFSPVVYIGQHHPRIQKPPISPPVIRFLGGKTPHTVITLDFGIHDTFADSQLWKAGQDTKKTPYGVVSADFKVYPGYEDGHSLPTDQMWDSAYYEDIREIRISSPKGLPLIVKVTFPGSCWLHLNGVSISEVSRTVTYRYCELHLSGEINIVFLGTADHE